jgi:hypothetical protein
MIFSSRSFKMAHNCLGLCEGRAKKYKSSNLAQCLIIVQMIDRNTNAQLTTEALPFAKPLLWAVAL